MLVNIEPSQLLWRTRGATWDFQFILRPKRPYFDSWLSIFEHIYPDNQAPISGVEYRKGRLIVGDRAARTAYPFLAASFTDEARTDSAGRPIQQFLVYVSTETKKSVVPLQEHDWARALLATLQPAYDAAFDLRREDTESGRDFLARLTQTFQSKLPAILPLTLDPKVHPSQYIDMGEVVLLDDDEEREKKAHRPGGTPPPAPRTRWGMLLIATALLVAIVLGLILCRVLTPAG